MKASGWIIFVYGLLIIFGGIMGFTSAQSTASLVWGSITGIILLFCGVGMLKERLVPAYFAIILTLLLDAFFTYRFLYSFVFIPSGLMALISLIVLISVVLLLKSKLTQQ